MKIITCASYYGSGSSAITDYLSEFDNFKSVGDYEFRFIQDPDGVRDLEYNLVENFNRHNSGHALKKYKRLVDFLSGNIFNRKYEKFFKGEFKQKSYEYIDGLTDYKFKGYWHEDLRDKGKLVYMWKRFVSKLINNLIFKTLRLKERNYNELRREITYGAKPSEEKFLSLTRKYTNDLFEILNKENKEFLIVDQLFPPTNLDMYTRYVDNCYVFLVDRDPRDMYLMEKIHYHGTIVPPNVEDFCKWFRFTRESRAKELELKNVIFIKFEDLIYKYDETTKRVNDFLGISEANHVEKHKYFNPNISIKNTKLYEKTDKYSDDIKYIEEHLKEFLYE